LIPRRNVRWSDRELTSSLPPEYQNVGHERSFGSFDEFQVTIQGMHRAKSGKIFRFLVSPTLLRESTVPSACLSIGLFLLVFWFALPLQADKHRRKEDYGLGFTTEIQAPESEVLEAVEAVADDGIIQGSKEYNKDKYIEHAVSAATSNLFPEWKEPGRVFYKMRSQVLDPRGFFESNDVGTLAVRYVVQGKDAGTTILKIDAVFVEDFRRKLHASDGSVESAECKDIQDHVDTLEAQKRQAVEDEKHREQELARRALQQKAQAREAEALASNQSGLTLEERVEQLRRKAERLVKAPGAQLRSAPFRSAATLKTLATGTQVVIVVQTPYWYGIETEDGQHGWIHRDQMEFLP
jgi:hypothetical protein